MKAWQTSSVSSLMLQCIVMIAKSEKFCSYMVDLVYDLNLIKREKDLSASALVIGRVQAIRRS